MFYRAPPNLEYFDAPRELSFLLRIEARMLRKATILIVDGLIHIAMCLRVLRDALVSRYCKRKLRAMVRATTGSSTILTPHSSDVTGSFRHSRMELVLRDVYPLTGGWSGICWSKDVNCILKDSNSSILLM